MNARIERFLEEHVGTHEVQDFAAAVYALVATGMLTAADAEKWKADHARFQAASRPSQGPYCEAVEAKAVELLQDLLAPVRMHADEGADRLTYRRYQEALSTLTGVRALSLETARPWFERQQRALTPAAPRPKPKPEPAMPFTAGQLTGVIVGAERVDGMRITCLELYDDCVIVRFHQRLPAEPADPVERRNHLTVSFGLEDDAGTPYRPAPIPLSDGCKPCEVTDWPQKLSGWHAFVPGARLDARRLTVTWREQHFTLSHDEQLP